MGHADQSLYFYYFMYFRIVLNALRRLSSLERVFKRELITTALHGCQRPEVIRWKLWAEVQGLQAMQRLRWQGTHVRPIPEPVSSTSKLFCKRTFPQHLARTSIPFEFWEPLKRKAKWANTHIEGRRRKQCTEIWVNQQKQNCWNLSHFQLNALWGGNCWNFNHILNYNTIIHISV